MQNKTKLTLSLTAGLIAATTAFALPGQGSREFTFSGVGQSDQDFDNNAFAFEGSYGYYQTDRWEWSVRQAISIADLGDGDDWYGSTIGAVDYHFSDGIWRPFVGLQAGVRYGGDFVNEDFIAGAQAGLKYYVKDDSFIFARANYTYSFDNADQVDDQWDEGSFGYAFGVGLNF